MLTLFAAGLIAGAAVTAVVLALSWVPDRLERLALAGWRLLAVLPPGRIHERHVRTRLGMPRHHPESCTRTWTQREQLTLGALQARTWPEGEWTDVIRYRDGAQ